MQFFTLYFLNRAELGSSLIFRVAVRSLDLIKFTYTYLIVILRGLFSYQRID